MSKYQEWYDNQPAHTRAWMEKQAVWHDADMFKAFLVGACFGIIVGFLLWI